MKRLWFIGLALFTAVLLIVGAAQLDVEGVNVAAQEASPSPATLPLAPGSEPLASPEASPVPDVTEPPLAPILLLQENPYINEDLGYQIGIIEGYEPIVVAGVPIIQSGNGAIAYTVAVRPRAADNPLNEAALAQVAIDTFARGEGFSTGAIEAVAGGVKLPWRGTLRQGPVAQSMVGTILSRQVPGKLLILSIAATEAQAAEVDAVFETLAESLQPLAPQL
jgi:hypothetical protein